LRLDPQIGHMPPFKAYVPEAGTCAQNPLTHRPFLQQTLEVRCPQSMKAKWVRVELRKIENLPGGAQFVDHVGQSPLTVWQSQEEDWGVLHSVPTGVQIQQDGDSNFAEKFID